MVRKKQPTFPNGDLGEEDGIITEKAGGSSSTSNGDHRTENKSGNSDEKVPRRVQTQVVKANGDARAHTNEGACADVVLDAAGDAKKTSAACNGEAEELKERKQTGL